MSLMEDFQAYVEAIPGALKKNYRIVGNLDKTLSEIQRHNELRCEQEIAEIEPGIRSGRITPDGCLVSFSDEALNEQKHCLGLADQKVAWASGAYEMVDKHIQWLDQYLKRYEEDLRRERDSTASASSIPGSDNNAKSGKPNESSRGGRKKSQLASAPAETATQTPNMDLDLPVDPNEPTYCFCNQVSYGEMVACDNPSCKVEWFHFGCVNLKEQPKGKWYCPDCAGSKYRRKGK